MAVKCKACGKFTTYNASEIIKCGKCTNLFHRACVNIAKDAKISPQWQCPDCKVQTPRKDNSEVPVSGESTLLDNIGNSPVASEAVSIQILNEIRQHRQEFKNMNEDFTSLKKHIEEFSSRIEIVESRISCLEGKFVEFQSAQPQCNAEVDILRSTVDKLKIELNEREQDTFSNDLEITCIPEEQGETIGRLVGLVASKLGVVCDEKDIVFVERVGVKRAPAPSGGTGANEQGRPRAIVVRVARRQLRDALQQAARTRRTLTTEGMGLAASPTRFFINERLSRGNKMLFYKARELAQSRGWRYVWTRNGRVLVRRESGSASFRVRMEEDLEKIFGKQ